MAAVSQSLSIQTLWAFSLQVFKTTTMLHKYIHLHTYIPATCADRQEMPQTGRAQQVVGRNEHGSNLFSFMAIWLNQQSSKNYYKGSLWSEPALPMLYSKTTTMVRAAIQLSSELLLLLVSRIQLCKQQLGRKDLLTSLAPGLKSRLSGAAADKMMRT